jgi:hypothetical protein
MNRFQNFIQTRVCSSPRMSICPIWQFQIGKLRKFAAIKILKIKVYFRATSGEDFIQKHMAALESEYVIRKIYPLWYEINFVFAGVHALAPLDRLDVWLPVEWRSRCVCFIYLNLFFSPPLFPPFSSFVSPFSLLCFPLFPPLFPPFSSFVSPFLRFKSWLLYTLLTCFYSVKLKMLSTWTIPPRAHMDSCNFSRGRTPSD